MIDGVAESFLRAVGAALLAMTASAPVARWLNGRGPSAWFLAVALPAGLPPLLAAAGYAHHTSVVVHAAAREMLYALLLAGRSLPLAVLARLAARERAGAEAAHALRLRFGWLGSLPQRLRGRGRGAAAAFLLAFLPAFAEFDTASFLLAKSWSVNLFDAQAGGLPPGESLRRAAGPLAVLAAAAAGLFALLARAGRQEMRRAGDADARWAAGILTATHLLLWVVPLGLLAPPGLAGMVEWLARPSLLRELAASLMTAGAATLLAVWACRLRAGAAGALALAGLAGPLLIGLMFLAGFSRFARPALDTPLPLWLAEGWVLLPLVLALRRAGGRGEPDPLRVQMELLAAGMDREHRRAARRLSWRITAEAWAPAVTLGILRGAADLTLPSLLAPPALPHAPVRLYNLMHYGHSDALAAMILAGTIAPLLLVVAVLAAMRLAHR